MSGCFEMKRKDLMNGLFHVGLPVREIQKTQPKGLKLGNELKIKPWF